MFVNIPWKGTFPLRSDQVSRIEYDEKGPFLRVRNANTGYPNKCRIVNKGKSSPKKSHKKSPVKEKTSPVKDHKTLHRISEGDIVHGTIRRTGPNYVAIVVDKVGPFSRGEGLEEELVRAGRDHLIKTGKKWKVDVPRAWDLPIGGGDELGPHVSLNFNAHIGDVGKRARLKVSYVKSWTEESRWVALFLEGPYVDNTLWNLHLSIAQQPL